MRISDWSSDVCSSDLRKARVVEPRLVRPIGIVEDEIERMDASKSACGQQVQDLPHRFGMAIAEVYPQKPVGGAGGGDHLLRLGAVAAKRLLAEDGKTMFQRPDHLVGLKRHWRCGVDAVDSKSEQFVQRERG